MRPISALFNLCLFFCCFAPSPSRSQWVQTGGPQGDYTSALAGDSARLFANSTTGVVASTDEGATWTATAFPNANVYSLLATRHALYAGTWQNGIRCSTDAGATWTNRDSGLTGAGAWLFTCFASDGSNLYAGCYSPWDDFIDHPGDLFRSSDEGMSWIRLHVPSTGIQTVASISGILLVSPMTGGSILRSTDGGLTWNNTSGISGSVTRFVGDDSTVYAGTTGAGVFVSVDLGLTWSGSNNGLTSLKVHDMASIGAWVCAGTEGGIFRSSDGGAHWIPSDSNLEPFRIQALFTHRSTVFAGTYGGGVFASKDSGRTWRSSSGGLIQTNVTALFRDSQGLYAASSFPGLVYRSTSGGSDWTPAQVGQGTSQIFVLAGKDSSIFAGSTSGMFRSTDKGETWVSRNSGLSGTSVTGLLVRGSRLWAGLYQQGNSLFSSTDDGATWTSSDLIYPYDVSCFGETATTIFAGTGLGLIKSTDEGQSWTGGGVGGRRIRTIEARGINIVAGTSGDGAYASTDGGLNWSAGDMAGVSVFDLHFVLNSLFAATSAGVYLSTNGGFHWTPVSTGLQGYTYSVADDGLSLYASTPSSGVWKRPLSEMVTGVNPTAEIGPNGFSLQQNFPNPFNPSTTIRYEISDIGYLKLAVYDLLGREVAVLVDEEVSAGSSSVVWDAAGLASGVYFCRMSVSPEVRRDLGPFVQVKRLLLVR